MTDSLPTCGRPPSPRAETSLTPTAVANGMTMRAGPTLLFARNELRNRWLGLLGLSVLIALAGAFVLIAATGARRVATAWDRFEDVTRAPNLVATPPFDQLDAIADDLRVQPGVEGVSAVAWLP